MTVSVHAFTETELEAVDEIIKAAYNIQESRKESLRRYLALQPGDSFVAEQNDAVIGFGGAIEYGPFAYIGLMCVHPSMQNQGVGGLLLDHLLVWLEARGSPTVLLDATPAGAPLYKRYGFIEDDRTVVLRQTQRVLLSQDQPEDVSILNEEDLPALVAFDAPCFGADRHAILASYLADDPQRALVVRNANRQITGYLISQLRTLGPCVARAPEDAERLLLHALTLPFDGEPGVISYCQPLGEQGRVTTCQSQLAPSSTSLSYHSRSKINHGYTNND